MVELRIEICILSAHGLGRSSSLWKPQWFAVGWIDPNEKYCTKIDSSGSPNPSWKTRFSVPIDAANSNLQGLSLSVEVYRREPIFQREKLQGAATIALKEFFAKFKRGEAWVEETASFQLRKRNSGSPKGFVDVSVRVFEERPGDRSHSGFGEAFSSPSNEIPLAIEDGPAITYPAQFQPSSFAQFENYTHNETCYSFPSRKDTNPAESSKEFHRPATPPPPPPPSHTGLLPSPFLGTTVHRLPEACISLSGARPSRDTGDPDIASGLGAGALAAGAVIFGDDFLSNSSCPSGFEGGSLNVSTDPPF
ncbi:uncharacterized protein M6B38_174580 [Iris pallida]|uniref:C2 domain-containing protein n=1 Tax=Iris pallida TaxID=29817 RepID=A0AAX6ER23_IRIPA|nr:uncharacterized protein M6B38_174580 [Iris pallida]